MIAALLNFLFIILLGIFIVVGVVAYKIYRTFHSVKKQFKGFRDRTGSSTDRHQATTK
jgi:flagellar basal body-associated protein FliL